MASINFNIPSIITQANLRRHGAALATSLERLSTGNRVNRAKDDPDGNAAIQEYDKEVRKGAKAEQNAKDASSLLQIVDGSMDSIGSMLQRLRELAVQAANDTLDSANRSYIQTEAQNILAEIDRVAESTSYNGKSLLTGANGDDPFSTGTREGRLQVGTGNVNIDDYVLVSLPVVSTQGLGIDGISFASFADAKQTIASLDDAVDSLGTSRSTVGALMNRMDARIENLQMRRSENSNMIAKLGDTDFAKESTAFATAQLLQQSALSIMAQANSRVSDVLKILGE
jgi:flagellin